MDVRTASLLLVSLCVMGCQADRSSPLEPELTGRRQSMDIPKGTNLGIFEVSVDLNTLAATVEMVAGRQGQQSELYNLEINDFLSWESFRVTGVSLTDDSLLLTYVVKHPFKAASNLAGPATAANREDLAITGRVVWLADSFTSDIWFVGDGDVRLNPRMVRNPDGYWSPGSLIDDPGTLANTFPYQLIVDEARDNRIGLSNVGNATGNYGGSGWQVAEFTSGITGFDVLAQGQSSTNTLEIARPEIGGGLTFAVTAALIAKYEDPRGGVDGDERRANRLPRSDNDVLKFTYRMPHGALDVSAISVIPPAASGSGDMSIFSAVHIRDWDARAIEAAQTNLAAETNSSVVSAGESGLPTVDIYIQEMTNFVSAPLAITDDDSGAGGDVGVDSGAANDELYFTGTSTGTCLVGGAITGLVRVTDVVDITPPADWLANRIDLGPGLTPLGTGHEGATYQTFTIELLSGSAGALVRANAWGGIGTDYATDVAVDDASNSYVVGSFDTTTDFDPGPGTQERTASAGLDGYVVSYDLDGAFRWVRTFEGDLADLPVAVAVDASGNTYIAGSFYGTCDFDPGPGDVERTSAGDMDAYVVSLDAAGDLRWVSAVGDTSGDEVRGLVVDPLGNSYATGRFWGTVDFNSGPGNANRTSSGLQDAFVLALTPTGTYRWAAAYGGTRFDFGYGIDQDIDGNLYACGTYEDAADLNPGAGVANHTAAGGYDSYLMSLTSNGAYRWSSAWGAGPSDEAYGVTVSDGGYSYITGYFGGACDFDPGPFAVNRVGLGFSDGYVLALNPWGSYRWVATINGTSHEVPSAIELDDYGRLYLAGYFQGTVDFCPGPVTDTRISQGENDFFVLSLGSYGSYRWVATTGSVPDNDHAAGIAVSPLGRSYTAGHFFDVALVETPSGTSNLTSAGLKDACLLVLEP